MIERAVAQSGARVLSADGAGDIAGPEGEMFRGIIDVFAQYERAVIRARTRATLASKKARGERVGRPRFGYVVAEGALASMPGRLSAVDAARALRAEGLSLRVIVTRLDAEWFRSSTGKALRLPQIVRIFVP
jgi:DNA invertase Pin-like site-specific DNA recombinase